MRVCSGQRGLVLLMVIVVITIAALSGTTAMYLAGAHLASAGALVKKTQSRSLAWSGVQAAMAEMADQREKLLDGAAPALTKEWELFTDEAGNRGVARLVEIGFEDPESGGSVAVSESAKLDVNTATAEMLAKVPGLDETSAKAIIAARGQAGFGSAEDLARVGGVPASLLRGGESDGEAGARGSARATALRDVLTVFSFDPNVQAGLGQNGSEHRGTLRVNLQAGWSDGLEEAIDARFGKGASSAVKGLMDRGTKFASMADVVNAARTAGIQPKDWAPVLDAFTVTEDPFLIGRVDVMRAPMPVLAAVPGISADAAAAIVAARAKLDEETRRSPVWITAQGIVTAEQFAKAVDYLATRSMQWRVRVEAGLLARDASGGAERASEAKLGDRVVVEAVIDVSSERPRVAYLRDVTLEEAARGLAAELASAEPVGSSPEPPTDVVKAGAEDGGTGAPAPAEAPAMGADFGKGMGELNLGTLNISGPSIGEPKVADAPETDPIQDKGAVEQTGPPARPVVPPGQDRRTGRWTTGKSAGGGS